MSLFVGSNAHQLEFQTELLHAFVLGGVRLEGLDRLQVTVKLFRTGEPTGPVLRHNLDLYNDTQVMKLVRKTAERLEIGTSIVGQAVSELTAELEAWRLEQLEQQGPEEPEAVVLSESEREAALAFLGEQGLMQRTSELIGQSGVIGEQANRLLMFIVFTSRKREQPLHVVSLGSSGAGKTHLQEKVAALIPEEDKVEITTLSENAFYYFGQRELQHKLILIEDLDGLGSAAAGGGGFYALRELQSKKKISKTVAHKNTKGETRAVHLTVEGPVSVAGCTTKERIYEDNANRSFLLYLDESQAQDEKIMAYQRAISAGKVNREQEAQAVCLLQNVQRVLEPVGVVNPFAEQLQIPREVFKPRRTNAHYLAFIEAVTFYHQRQRSVRTDPQTGEMYVETTLEDIAEANRLMKDVLLRKADELTGVCRNYFERLKGWLADQEPVEDQEEVRFTNRGVSLALRLPIATVKRHHHQLETQGLIRVVAKLARGQYAYAVVDDQEYASLQQQVHSVLDNMLDRLSSSPLAQPENEPVNPQKTSAKTPTAQPSSKRQARGKKIAS